MFIGHMYRYRNIRSPDKFGGDELILDSTSIWYLLSPCEFL